MRDHVGVGESFDADFREIIVLNRKIQLYFVNGLCDTEIIVELIKALVNINDHEQESKEVVDIVRNRIVHQQLVETDDLQIFTHNSQKKLSFILLGTLMK